jgi:dihydrofolate reductase
MRAKRRSRASGGRPIPPGRSLTSQAQAVAGEKSIGLCAADVAQQFLRAGLLDEIQVSVAPIVLGGGVLR